MASIVAYSLAIAMAVARAVVFAQTTKLILVSHFVRSANSDPKLMLQVKKNQIYRNYSPVPTMSSNLYRLLVAGPKSIFVVDCRSLNIRRLLGGAAPRSAGWCLLFCLAAGTAREICRFLISRSAKIETPTAKELWRRQQEAEL